MIKKVLSSIVLISIIWLQLSVAAFSDVIEDDVVRQSFEGQTLHIPACRIEIIEDNTAADLVNKNLSVPARNVGIIEDDVADKAFQNVTLNKPVPNTAIIEDEAVFKISGDKNSLTHKNNYKLIDETAETVYIVVFSSDSLKSEDLKIGQKVTFRVKEDVCKGGKVFVKKDTTVEAFIENISKREKYGDPEEIEVGRFATVDTDGNIINLIGGVRKQGVNRAKWVKPVFYTGYCALPFGAPLMLVGFIKGGKAKIEPNQNYKLYYE